MDVALTNEIARRLCSNLGWRGPQYIDHGASAAVYKIVRPDQGPAALKVYDPKFFSGSNALIEAKRCALQGGLKEHGHPNLIEVLEVGELAKEATWYLLMEFCPWTSLEKRLHQVPDDQVHNLLKQLTEAVLFLDKLGYVHRDIKPANIAVSDDFTRLKLLDLGVLRKILPDEGSGTDGNEKRRFIATAQYSPPEFLTREELPGPLGFTAINIYQIGAVLHDLIMKEPLFAAEAATENKYIVYEAVTTKLPRVVSATVPVRLTALCGCALEKNPERRIRRVTLEDFLADADDAEALRRRLVKGKEAAKERAPSFQVAETSVRRWIGTAARIEAATLGSTSIRRGDIPGGIQWTIRFSEVDQPVIVQLRTVGAKLRLDVVSATDPPVANTVVELDEHGPDMRVEDIPSALSVQYLYALSLAHVGMDAAAEESGAAS